MTALASGDVAPSTVAPRHRPAVLRYAPAVAGYAFVAAVLLVAGTPVAAIARWTGYALLAVLLPGTLVFRALRRRPHTLVEDLALGAAVGLVLELAAWAACTALGVPGWLRLWPIAVLVPFAAVPRLRRHWRVRYDTAAPAGWAWSLAGVVAGFTLYLYGSFLAVNPVLPRDEGQAQYLDLAYQLSLAGAATHQVPPDLPQVAGEPLHYHWFGFAHVAATSLVSGVDLPTVYFRLGVPALCALAAVLVAVVGWRITGRPYAGVVAAALLFTVGEFGFENGWRQLFGSQATFIVWGSPSMTYSWVLLLPLIAALGELVGRARGVRVPAFGRGAWLLVVLFLAASTGAKASSLPVVLAALAFTAALALLVRRRLPRAVLVAAGLCVAAQLFATAVLFAFESHGVTLDPFSGLRTYVPAGGPAALTALVWAAVAVAFLLNLQLRLAGILALLRHRRWRLEPVQVFLLGGALAGPAIYLLVGHPGSSNQYFTRTGFAFGVLLSGWGWVEVADRAALSARGRRLLGAAAAGFAVLLTAVQLGSAISTPATPAYAPVLPLLCWAGALAAVAVVVALYWPALCGRWPRLAGRGGLLLLTAVLVAGAPGLVLDAAAARKYPNGGAYAVVAMPASRVEAARWVRAHSDPDDVLATNVHCRAVVDGWCDARSFWLSGYAERSVLLEGWAFAPRVVGRPEGPYAPFWDAARQRANDEAFTAPTAAGLAALRDRYGVCWLVVDRVVAPEAPELRSLADLRFTNSRMAVYRLR
ncbi:hypothetical protein ONA91_06605 [Micromonospora sp. DR5-3]|uniref:DUF2298 domain-containing protein n=1 Tax=unclassified Micromonospora TaxID=2617518 RepID=UPI0011D8492F|nr:MULTISPECIES: DUF2298 domain-containing protein [unclassified Micromonospora]MCW3814126.1 hypothetical protein [Micromonospora sp. DR5-3]TYC25012.1 hypothetical protein FXF52_06780 [Micromonospora sp. MP36]